MVLNNLVLKATALSPLFIAALTSSALSDILTFLHSSGPHLYLPSHQGPILWSSLSIYPGHLSLFWIHLRSRWIVTQIGWLWQHLTNQKGRREVHGSYDFSSTENHHYECHLLQRCHQRVIKKSLKSIKYTSKIQHCCKCKFISLNTFNDFVTEWAPSAVDYF